MLKIAPKAIAYYDWQIRVVMYDQHFVFQCYPPGCLAYSNDGHEYPNFRSALIAARQFIDRETAIKSILTVVEEWLEKGLISDMEYWALTAFD